MATGKEKTYKKPQMVSTASKLMYASGDLGHSMITATVSSFLMFFGTTLCHVPGTLMGLAIALGTVWDALTDPIVGYLSDRKKSKLFGRRHGFILISVFGLAFINIVLWAVPVDASSVGKFFYFLGCLIAFQLFSTFYVTPHSALALELSNDYTERTTIASFNSVFQLVGTILPTLLMAVFTASGQSAESYRTMSYVSSAMFLILGVTCFLGSYSHIPRLRSKAMQEAEPEKQSFLQIFKNFFVVFKQPTYRNLILGFSISLMSVAFLTSAGFHMFTYTFGLPPLNMYLLMAAVFFMTILSQPFWIWFVNKFDKKAAVLLGISFLGVGVTYMLLIFIIRSHVGNATIALLPALLLAGIGMGALYTMPTAMLGDTTDIEKQKTKKDNTATYAGFMTFCNKVCNAITLLVVGVLLDIIGFDEATAMETPSVQWGLGIIVIGGLLLSLALGFFFYSKYNTKKADVLKLNEAETPKNTGIVRKDGSGKRSKR